MNYGYDLLFVDILVGLAMASGSSATQGSGDEEQLDCAGMVAAGRLAEAIIVCNAEIKHQPEDKPVDTKLLLNRAIAYAGENQAVKALSDFDAVLKVDEGSYAALLGRAGIYVRQGRFADARADAEAAKKGDAEGAKVVLKKIESAESGLTEAQKLMGEKKWTEANAALEALQLAKEPIDLSKQVYTLRAQCLTWLGRYTDAIRMYQGRAVLELESSETEYEVGKLQLALGNLEKGRKLIDACARNNSDHRAALALRKKLKAISGLIEEADSGKLLIHQAVASLEETLKSTSKVAPEEPYYDEALAGVMLSKPFELPLLRLLCAKHLRLKQSDLALERCQRVLDLASAAKTSGVTVTQADEEAAWLAAGEAFVLAERFEEAVNLLKRAQRQFPRSQRLNEALQKTNASLKKSKQKDYYKILGVPKDASESDIRRAFNKAARRWHPDKQRDEASKAEAVAKMQDLNAALAVLTDEKKRAQFDAGVDPEDPQAAAGNPFHGGGPFGGHGGPFGGGGGFHFNFEDLFRQQQQQQRRGYSGHGAGYGGGGGGGGGYRQQYQRRQGGGQRFEDFFKFDL